MGRSKKRVSGWLDRHSGRLLLLGVAAAALANGLEWSQNRRLAQRFRAEVLPTPRFADNPKVSILVPAWNESPHLAACIESILALRYPNKELVVCAGGQDGSLEIAQRYEGQDVKVLEQLPGQGKQSALQCCFECSSGEIVYLTDADCTVDDACFEATIAPVALEGEDASTGCWKPFDALRSNSLVLYQWTHHLFWQAALPDYAPTLDGRNAAVRRAALQAAHGFDVPAPIGTDYVLSQQLCSAGYRIRTVRKSRVQTSYPDSIPAYWRQLSRWFRNRLVLGLRFGSRSDVLSQTRAGGVACALLAVPVLASFGCRLLWYPWLVLVAHLGLSQTRVTHFAICADEEAEIAPKHYPLFVCYGPLNWIGMARGLMESLSRARRLRW